MHAGETTTVKSWVRRKAVWGACVALGLLVAAILLASCGSQLREGEATSYLIIDSFQAASGAEPNDFGATLHSDVETVVDAVPTVFNDIGQVTFRLALKDPGIPSAPQNPTSNNHITITRFRVEYLRADGRNTPGVDVPYPIDGAMTVTVSGTFQAAFTIVRHSQKREPPLRALVGGGGARFITTAAEVTFYGHDQTGRSVSVKGQMTITFGDFGDPA